MNTDDLNFAYKVRHALNEKLDTLPPSIENRLAQSRQMAIARKKAHVPQLRTALASPTGNFGNFFQSFNWLVKVGVAVPLLALAAGMVGIYQAEQQQRISELAELDAAVLFDELPLSAYLDHGFNAYLTQNGQ